jgi:Rhodopirellula transposase DDE domain
VAAKRFSCDAQFHFINDAVLAALAENHPVISVDTKKKELAGDFKNAGREWRPQGIGGRRADYRTIPLHPRLRATVLPQIRKNHRIVGADNLGPHKHVVRRAMARDVSRARFRPVTCRATVLDRRGVRQAQIRGAPSRDAMASMLSSRPGHVAHFLEDLLHALRPFVRRSHFVKTRVAANLIAAGFGWKGLSDVSPATIPSTRLTGRLG